MSLVASFPSVVPSFESKLLLMEAKTLEMTFDIMIKLYWRNVDFKSDFLILVSTLNSKLMNATHLIQHITTMLKQPFTATTT